MQNGSGAPRRTGLDTQRRSRGEPGGVRKSGQGVMGLGTEGVVGAHEREDWERKCPDREDCVVGRRWTQSHPRG